MKHQTLALLRPAAILMLMAGLASPAMAQGAACKPVAVAGTHTSPPYPKISRRLGEQGVVDLRVAITGNGAAGNVQLLRSSDSPRLDEAAVTHVRERWQWLPGGCQQAGVRVTFVLLDAGTTAPESNDPDNAVVSSVFRIPKP